MKTDIHPKYEKTTIKCACGAEVETKSTVSPAISVELCSACHPFYTGKQKFVDTAGRVDKFRARLEKAEGKKAASKKETAEEVKKSNTEKLAEIKKEITTDKMEEAKTEVAAKPMTVTQENTSDVEAAAEEELKVAKELDNK